jgi:Domain of Unknown Function with PDB structure (DUF3857)/Transglutaminase-like superfamily
MSNRVCYSQQTLRPVSNTRTIAVGHFYSAMALFLCVLHPTVSRAGDAPAWMHAAASGQLPKVDDKTDAVTIYSEDITIVHSDGKMKTIERRAYKILRPGGKDFGVAQARMDSNSKINGMRAWCIPAQGKDYEVKDTEAVDVSLGGTESMELATDVKVRLLKIPAAEPGNVVGYEVEKEERPYILQDWWEFQTRTPVKEARYSLQLPSGWEYKVTWLNHPAIQPTSVGSNQWQWVVTDVPAIRKEDDMPPWQGLASQMIVSLLPPGSSGRKGFETWGEMGRWESKLFQGRRDPSPEIQQKVTELTAGAPNTLAKMQAIAAFVQKDIRYVAIELGIGGWQPHPAREIYSHRYGDCKDKATLMSAMLKEIGVDSYYLDINVERGAVAPSTPPQMYWFNHEILGIRLPEDVKDPSLLAIYHHSSLGRVLIFDPTSEVTPLGQLSGHLQANYGLLVIPDGGDLIQLPQLSPSTSGTGRGAKLRLNPEGTLSGEVNELHRGDSADEYRYYMRSVKKDTDRIKPVETTLSHSLGTFQITKASISNLTAREVPLGLMYTFTAEKYAKNAGNLLLVRPRVLGNLSSDILEKKEPRKYPVEFDGPERYTDLYEIELPNGYEMDELPPPASADYSFATYHSKTELKGNVLVYQRTFEIKELSVPVDKLEQLKTLYRMIATDERNTAILKPKAVVGTWVGLGDTKETLH